MFLSTAQNLEGRLPIMLYSLRHSCEYELRTKICTTKQATLSVIEYYNVKKWFWLVLDHYQKLVTKDPTDTNTFQIHMERLYFLFFGEFECGI